MFFWRVSCLSGFCKFSSVCVLTSSRFHTFLLPTIVGSAWKAKTVFVFTQQSHRLMLQQRGCCNDFLFSAEAFPFENGCLGHCLQCVHHHRKRISLCKAMDYFNAARSTHLPDHTDGRKRNHNETLQCPRTRSQSCNFMQVHVADIRRQTDLLPHYITWALRSTIDKQSLTGPTFSTRGQHHADKSSGLSETAVTRAQVADKCAPPPTACKLTLPLCSLHQCRNIFCTISADLRLHWNSRALFLFIEKCHAKVLKSLRQTMHSLGSSEGDYLRQRSLHPLSLLVPDLRVGGQGLNST